MNRFRTELARLEAQPLPTKAERDQRWLAVQVALAAFLPVWFAEAYRAMERAKVQEKMKLRALAVQQKMQQERVNALRGTIGLHHLKKLKLGRGRAHSKLVARLRRRKETAASPPPPSA